MITVKDIEDAIRALSPEDRAQLADDLPELLPELNDDAEWHRIINDPRSRPNLSAFIDKIDAQIK